MDERELRVRAWLQNRSLEQTQEYAQRGRPYAALPLDELKRRWVETFRDWGRDMGMSDLIKKMNDLQAELRLRNDSPPYETVREEIQMFADRAANAVHDLAMEPDKLRAAARELDVEIEAFYRALGAKRSN